MPLNIAEQEQLTTFVSIIEHELQQREICNGLRAIGDAAICSATVSYGVACDLMIFPDVGADLRFYHHAHSLIQLEKMRNVVS